MIEIFNFVAGNLQQYYVQFVHRLLFTGRIFIYIYIKHDSFAVIMLVGLTETGGNTHPDILETYQVSLWWHSLRSAHHKNCSQ